MFFYLKFVNCMRKLVIKVECYCLIVLFSEKYTQVYINHANLTRNFIELKKNIYFCQYIFKEFDLNIENYSNIDKSFEKVKYSIKTQLRKKKVLQKSIEINLKKNFHHTLTNQNYLYIVN